MDSPREVACIDDKYTRDLENYLWLCSKCHWKYDHINTGYDTLHIVK